MDDSETTARGFDPDALRDKYRQERDKRLRPDANDQYLELSGPFSHYLEDPYVQPTARAPNGILPGLTFPAAPFMLWLTMGAKDAIVCGRR